MTAAERALLAELRQRVEEHDTKIAALFRTMAEATRAAGLAPEPVRPDLRVLPGGGAS